MQKKVVLWNSKTLIFTPKISIRRHNARHFFQMSECRIYHGCLGVVHHVVRGISCHLWLEGIFATKTTRSPAPRVLREIVCLGNGIATVGMPGIPTKSWEHHPLTNGKSTWESIIKECDFYYHYFGEILQQIQVKQTKLASWNKLCTCFVHSSIYGCIFHRQGGVSEVGACS